MPLCRDCSIVCLYGSSQEGDEENEDPDEGQGENEDQGLTFRSFPTKRRADCLNRAPSVFLECQQNRISVAILAVSEDLPLLPDTANVPHFSTIVDHIRTHHPDGITELDQLLKQIERPLRSIMRFRDCEDGFQDLLITLTEQIRAGQLQKPGALVRYIYEISRRSTCTRRRVECLHRELGPAVAQWYQLRAHHSNPERDLIERERRRQVSGLFGRLPARSREILERYYLFEQSAEQIQGEMDLTETQYRLLKNRAKKLLEYLGRQLRGEHEIPLPVSAYVPVHLRAGHRPARNLRRARH